MTKLGKLIVGGMIAFAEAKRMGSSYRYGELASFEEQMGKALKKPAPDAWHMTERPMSMSHQYGDEHHHRHGHHHPHRRHHHHHRRHHKHRHGRHHHHHPHHPHCPHHPHHRHGHGKHHPWVKGTPATSYRYGSMVVMPAKSADGRRYYKVFRLVKGQPMSYRYGQHKMGIAKMRKEKRKSMKKTDAMKKGRQFPPFKGNKPVMSYRYGTHVLIKNQMQKARLGTAKRPHPPFNGNKAIPSYRYGQEHIRKEQRRKLRRIAKRMGVSVQDVIALRDGAVKAKANSELDMIMKPLRVQMGKQPKVKHTTSKAVHMYQDREGKLRQAQQQVDVYEMDVGRKLKHRVIKVRAFDGKDAIVRGQISVLSDANKPVAEMLFGPAAQPSAMPQEAPMKAASIGSDMRDKFGGWKDKVLADKNGRILVSILLGFLSAIVMIFVAKALFSLWTKIGRRHEDEENRALLKGELESIHPISIVYKN